jgi:hypothetical protein
MHYCWCRLEGERRSLAPLVLEWQAVQDLAAELDAARCTLLEEQLTHGAAVLRAREADVSLAVAMEGLMCAYVCVHMYVCICMCAFLFIAHLCRPVCVDMHVIHVYVDMHVECMHMCTRRCQRCTSTLSLSPQAAVAAAAAHTSAKRLAQTKHVLEQLQEKERQLQQQLSERKAVQVALGKKVGWAELYRLK